MDYSYETSNGSITAIAVLVGDANNDGKVDIKDAAKIAQYLDGDNPHF